MQHESEALEDSADDSSQNLLSFEDDLMASSTPSEAVQETPISTSSSEEDLSRLAPKREESTPPLSSSLYQQFSRSQSEPPMSSPYPTEEGIPWKSTRQMILDLERKAQKSSETFPIVVKRAQRAAAEAKAPRVGAVEHFAQQPIAVPIHEMAEDPELKKLKRAIVRGSRTSKGLSLEKEKELARQGAIDVEDLQDG